ncbi:MAG: OadG family protein [Clostridiales bacterium]|nr:OadG family protein [Clostridiales bacterium]
MYSIPFVVLMGLGTVFTGLVSIIFLTTLMSYLLRERTIPDKTVPEKGSDSQTPSVQEPKDDLKFVSAVFAVLADNLNIDLTNVKVTITKA